mgnify:CR=1 FL=1
MSLPGDPETGLETHPWRVSKVLDASKQTLDPALHYLSNRWEVGTTRWTTICHLRVLLLRWFGTGITYEDVVEHIPAPYKPTYGSGRLASIPARVGFGQPIAAHMNIDWFGPTGVNWWGPGVVGETTEHEVATKLLWFLEEVTGLGASVNVSDIGSWSWPDGNPRPVVKDALDALKPFGGLGNSEVHLHWKFDGGNPVVAEHTGDTFTIHTPVPDRRDSA